MLGWFHTEYRTYRCRLTLITGFKDASAPDTIAGCRRALGNLLGQLLGELRDLLSVDLFALEGAILGHQSFEDLAG